VKSCHIWNGFKYGKNAAAMDTTGRFERTKDVRSEIKNRHRESRGDR
jgi:hypothetical protein